jgi:tetratricopeptide (TPR) repeat protein
MASDGNIANLLGMAKTAVLGGNHQEAMAYFNRVLEIDPTVSEAWLGKGTAAAWQSTLVHIRFPEAMIAFNHAIANAGNDRRQAVTNEAVLIVNQVAVALYQLARNHMTEYASLDSIWPDYLDQVGQLLEALEQARAWSPADRNTLDNIAFFCKDNIEGYSFWDKINRVPAVNHISPEYEQLLRGRLDSAVAAIQAIDPTYAPPTITKKARADACFVVTATMGDFNHPDVVYLRQFRDRWIAQRRGGDALIDAYYRVGPSLAALIERSERLRALSYRFIVQPAVRFARRRRW